MLGALFVCVTLFLPKGIVGTLRRTGGDRRPRSRRRRSRADAAGMEPADEPTNEHARTRCSISTASRVSFDGFKALNNLSLHHRPGEMRAIIGPNGAGKTTMMDIITGKTRPDDGDVLFGGAST